MNLLDFAILSFGSLFVIVDPLTTVPAFLAMTERNSIRERVRMAKLACFVTFLILMVFYFGGARILGAFGITVTAFEIAGGVLLFIIALDMLRARRTALKETPEEQAEGMSKEDIAVTPLAIPMLAGPGAITAVILLESRSISFAHHAIAVSSICVVSLITFLVLRLAAVRSRIFSGITLRVISRIMGLLLAAIAVQFIINGVSEVLQW